MEIKDLVQIYGTRRVLDGVSFVVPEGMITVILGGSGSGKTTLLRRLIGLDSPTSGQVIFRGAPIDLSDSKADLERRKKIGMLFQGGALFNSMTVAENVALPLREHTDLDENVIGIIVRMKLEQVGLAGAGELMPEQLSGGMKKRAGLARALAMEPELLCVDEPSAGLDPITAAGLDHLLINLKETFNMTIVVITHELPSLQLIADWVVMIDKGRVLFQGDRQALNEVQHPRIRQFLDRKPETVEADQTSHLDWLTGEG